MNHDWLLFLIMSQLLLMAGEKKLEKGDWWAGIDFVLALIFVVGGIIHFMGEVHD